MDTESLPALDGPGHGQRVVSTPSALFATLYHELRRLARREVRRNGAYGFLSTSTVVHEAWIDISRRSALEFQYAGQFLGYAARAMRGLVVDRLRAASAQRRGGGLVMVSLETEDGEDHHPIAPETDPQQLSEALEELAALEPALAEVVDLKFFCGFTLAEIAVMQKVSERTVQRRWEKARLLLFTAMKD
jgi:RNA polymerase sigma factor (TIGR02999 family)